MNILNDILNDYGTGDNEMKTRIVKLEDRCRALETENHKHKESFKKVNELLKECIRRIESNEHHR